MQIYKGWNMVIASRTFKIYIQCLTIEWLNKKGGGDPCLSWACECRHNRPQSLLQWVPQGAVPPLLIICLLVSFLQNHSFEKNHSFIVAISQSHNLSWLPWREENHRTKTIFLLCSSLQSNIYVIKYSIFMIDNGILHCCLWDF